MTLCDARAVQVGGRPFRRSPETGRSCARVCASRPMHAAKKPLPVPTSSAWSCGLDLERLQDAPFHFRRQHVLAMAERHVRIGEGKVALTPAGTNSSRGTLSSAARTRRSSTSQARTCCSIIWRRANWTSNMTGCFRSGFEWSAARPARRLEASPLRHKHAMPVDYGESGECARSVPLCCDGTLRCGGRE